MVSAVHTYLEEANSVYGVSWFNAVGGGLDTRLAQAILCP